MLLVHPIFRLLSLFYFLYRYIYIARIKAKILMGRYYRTKVKQNKQKNQQMKNNSYKLSRPKDKTSGQHLLRKEKEYKVSREVFIMQV